MTRPGGPEEPPGQSAGERVVRRGGGEVMSLRPHLWWRYDLTKAVLFMREGGWRLWGHALVIGRFGLVFIWKERNTP